MVKFVFSLIIMFIILPLIRSSFVIGDDGTGVGGQPGLEITISKEGIYDFVFRDTQPWAVAFIDSLEIPPFSSTVDFGLGKAQIDLDNFVIEDFVFFTDDLIQTRPSDNGLLLKGSGASIVISLEYRIKLLTPPYTYLSGDARISVDDFEMLVSASESIIEDTSDTSCPNGEEMGACGYSPKFIFDELSIALNGFSIEFIGFSSSLLQAIVDILDDLLIPFMTSFVSTAVTEALNEFFANRDLSMDAVYWYDGRAPGMSGQSKFVLGYAADMIFEDDYLVMQTYSVGVYGEKKNSVMETSVVPSYDPQPLPYAMFSSDMGYTISIDSINSVLYNVFHNANEQWSPMKGTFDTVSCVPTRNGCNDDDGNWTGGYSSSYVIQNNLGRDIDHPGSPFAPLFTTRYWQQSLPDLYSICSECYIDVSYTWQTVDGTPVVPEAIMRVDGFDVTYSDLYLIINVVQVSDGSSVASIGFETNLKTDAILWSDHAYVNFIQSITGIDVNLLSIIECQSNSDIGDNFRGNDSDYSCGVNDSEWTLLLNILSSVFLDSLFSTPFMQQSHGMLFFLKLPMSHFFSCTVQDEGVYYVPSGGYAYVSCNISECMCQELGFDDFSRNDDGTVYCVKQSVGGYAYVSCNISECMCQELGFDDFSRNDDGTVYCVKQSV
ncbi:hypothetical protein ADUPG1_006029 [Aduncisulcus paluster]|uniref:Uncharacterized protein n=1 Tax=Aduncisulcus paluster TaxID=2918883 RepID=A0ABQ5KGI3_9EUKA|nr:hypothetical protein ADUPG1_006029 [Aduncisulcus paluster]